MSNPEHLAILRQGSATWNAWRRDHPAVLPDLSDEILPELPELSFLHADLHGANLRSVTLLNPNFNGANLRRAILTEATFIDPLLIEADFSFADLRGASAINAQARFARFNHAKCQGLSLHGADLWKAEFRYADLRESDLTNTHMLQTDFSRADLSGSYVYGVAAWDVVLTEARQDSLVISEVTDIGGDGNEANGMFTTRDPRITVDNLEVAQFIHLLLRNDRIRRVIDSITSKVVLILGRFTPDRKAVLDGIREELRRRDWVPILFDFDKPTQRDFTETIVTLAGMARFVVADISNPSSSPLELQATVPNYMIPFVTILQKGERPFSMFRDLKAKYGDWVLDVLEYDSVENLRLAFESAIIAPALEKHAELTTRKAQEIVRRDIRSYLPANRP